MWEKNSFDIVFNFFSFGLRSGYEALCELRELVKINPAVSALRLYRTATGFYFPFFILINQRWPRFFAVVVKKENTQTQKTALLFLCVFLITYNQIWMIAITFYLVFSLMIATITCYLLYKYFLFWSPNTKDGQQIFERQFLQIKETLATRILMGCWGKSDTREFI